MQFLLFFLSQLSSYGVLPWLGFVAIAFGCARYGGWLGVIAGHFLVAVLVSILDVQWVQEQMRAPGWDGLPDMDFVFYFGLIVRIVLINSVLLPVSVLAVRFRAHQRQAQKAKAGP